MPPHSRAILSPVRPVPERHRLVEERGLRVQVSVIPRGRHGLRQRLQQRLRHQPLPGTGRGQRQQRAEDGLSGVTGHGSAERQGCSGRAIREDAADVLLFFQFNIERWTEMNENSVLPYSAVACEKRQLVTEEGYGSRKCFVHVATPEVRKSE